MIETALFKVFDFFARNKWAQIALAVVVAVFTFGVYVNHKEKKAVERAKERWEKEALKERARIVETVDQLEQETEDAKDRAIAAPDAVDDVSSADELRERYPENASVILRPREAGSRSGPR